MTLASNSIDLLTPLVICTIELLSNSADWEKHFVDSLIASDISFRTNTPSFA